jgi:plastocyanin
MQGEYTVVKLGRLSLLALGAVATLVAGCGSKSPAGPSGPGGGNQPTITITSAGVSPATLTVPQGTRVLFINNDNRQHEMNSDPHPEHTDCQEINAIGFINPGQRKETGNLNTVRTCGYHDHNDFTNTRLQGRIVIQ